MSRRSRALRPRQSTDTHRVPPGGALTYPLQSPLGPELAELARLIHTDPQPLGTTQADLELQDVLCAAAPAFAVDHATHRKLTAGRHYTPRMSLWRAGGESAQQSDLPSDDSGPRPPKTSRAERRAAARQAERGSAPQDVDATEAATDSATAPADAARGGGVGKPDEWSLIGVAMMPPSLVPTPAELKKSMRETMADCGAKVAVWSCKMAVEGDGAFIFLAAVHADGAELVAISSYRGEWRQVPANEQARDKLLSFYLDSARRTADRAVSWPSGDSPRAVVARDLLATGSEAQALLDGVFELNEDFAAAISAEKAASQKALEAAKRVHDKAMARSLKDLKKTEALLAAATARSAELQKHLRASTGAKAGDSRAPSQQKEPSEPLLSLAQRADALFFPKAQGPAIPQD